MVIPDFFYRHCTFVYLYESYFLCMNTLLIVYKKYSKHFRWSFVHVQAMFFTMYDSHMNMPKSIMILICVALHMRIIFIFFHMTNIQYTYNSHVIGNTYDDITYVGGASELIKILQTFLQKHAQSVLNILELQLSFKGLIFSSPELFWLPVHHCLLTFHIFIFLSRARG